MGTRLAVPLSALRTLGKATTPWPDCPVADPSAATGTLLDTIKQEDLVHTHYKVKQRHSTHPPEPQSHGHLYSTSHSSVGFFSRMCPEPVLNSCPSHSVSAWEVSQNGCPEARAQERVLFLILLLGSQV